ncbi:hypothetical protein MCAP1_003395 [Malassezia caprae]|uniref:Xylanolytic transcriptional activator regulatory domain-containing protein n=1 Tax=Malassezia caprae TaxID=1381934 RepID=A0AAF0EB69_9BASI|nr:hypothetical protein MCAP1_003395 [Malassezia caprae]
MAPSLPLFESSKLTSLFSNDRAVWTKCVQSYLDLLPSRFTIEDLVRYYVREIDPIYGFVSESILHIHLELLFSHLGLSQASGRHEQKRPDTVRHILGSLGASGQAKAMESVFWTDARNYGLLSLLFAILYAASSMMDIHELQARRVCESQDPGDIEARINAWHDAGIFFFQNSNMIQEPTLWTLQNFNILSIKYLNMREMHIVVIWNHLAISLAQQMGLNRMGSTLDDLTHDSTEVVSSHGILDNMLWVNEVSPKDLPQRELARIIWATLLRFDWFRSAHVGYSYSVCDSMNQTSAPAALLPKEVLMLRELSHMVLADPNRPSPTVFLRIHLDIGRIVRQGSEILLRRHSQRQKCQLTFEETMHMDRQLRDVKSSLPKYFDFEQDPTDADNQTILQEHPYLKIQRLFLQEQIHYRLLRLHLPFIETEIQAGHSSLSMETCIEGASISIAVHEELERTNNPNRRVPFLFWHLLTSATVLQRIMMHYSMPQKRQMQLLQSLRHAVHYLEEAPQPVSFSTNVHLQAALDLLRRFCQGG